MKGRKSNSYLITGGCGFVGRNLIKKLISQNKNIWVIDDLSIGQHPDIWLNKKFEKINSKKNYIAYSNSRSTIHFVFGDIIDVLSEEADGLPRLPQFHTVFHFASIVGGREVIDGNPILVGKDLAIDSVFFYWLTKMNREAERVLYASSSAAYPVVLQGSRGHRALKESFINFKDYIGMPDMTYGWSKLTGEYLSRLASERYSIPIACVRPFSGFGEDQDFSYPIPSIGRRIARRDNPISVWGTGRQGRDFVHIDDCVEAFFVVMKNIKNGGACNIGSGKLTSFIDAIEIFAKLEGYKPGITALRDKPVGVSSRYANTSLLRSFGWSPKISREQGFGRVLEHIKKYRMDD